VRFWIDSPVAVTVPAVVAVVAVVAAAAAAVDDVGGVRTDKDSAADEDVRRKGPCHLRTVREGVRWDEIATWRAEGRGVERSEADEVDEEVAMYCGGFQSRWWGSDRMSWWYWTFANSFRMRLPRSDFAVRCW
jgi:hypothetical protein